MRSSFLKWGAQDQCRVPRKTLAPELAWLSTGWSSCLGPGPWVLSSALRLQHHCLWPHSHAAIGEPFSSWWHQVGAFEMMVRALAILTFSHLS